MAPTTMTDEGRETVALSELPTDELIVYGQDLGLRLDDKMGRGELLRLIRERQELLLDVDRDALLDVVVWARRPVRASASKEELAKEIASIIKMDFDGLSDRGLLSLARLRGLSPAASDPRADIEQLLRDHEPFWDRVRRKRRRMVGSLITRLLDGDPEQSDEYRFLPEDGKTGTLRKQIEDEGVVGGIARKLRGAADDYVREKLDEIEERIDRKLDEIDHRLAEWRDREIANRLRIIKLTLVASILVALLSLGYSYIKPLLTGG
jgi:hypothetical protein